MSVRRGYADGPFGQIHYCDTGGDGHPLILLHQAPMSLRQFDGVYPLLAAGGARAIGIDLPGFGASDWSGDIPSIADYAEVVPAVLHALSLESAHLGGHHTGAMVCTEASLRYPDQVRSLTLSGPAPLTREERQEYLDTIVAEERDYQPKLDGSHLAELWERRIAWVPTDHDNAAALCTGYVLQPLMAPAPFWYGHQAAFSYDMAEALTRVSHPTLVLANTTDMIYSLGERTMEMRPDFDYTEIEGGGVDPTDFSREAWASAVLAYISKI